MSGGGRWFRNLGGLKFEENLIDPRYAFSRAAAGKLIKNSDRPQVVFVVGDGDGPLKWYEWVKGTWIAHKSPTSTSATASRSPISMATATSTSSAPNNAWTGEPGIKAYIFFGDGKGNFTKSVVVEGLDFHEAKVADLDGDGRLDIIAKPYNYQSPRIDIFLNLGPKGTTP